MSSKEKQTPKPRCFGSFQDEKNGHFYISQFVPLLERTLPKPEVLASMLKCFHNHRENPEGRFGYYVTTYNGNIPQYVEWKDTWEKFFKESFQYAYYECVKRNKTWKELHDVVQQMKDIVIPRLSRPLETDGRSIKPVLLHGDLWEGNAGVSGDGNVPVIFDFASFWGYHECKSYHAQRTISSLKTTAADYGHDARRSWQLERSKQWLWGRLCRRIPCTRAKVRTCWGLGRQKCSLCHVSTPYTMQ
jgi:fructosamine-3-kinase